MGMTLEEVQKAVLGLSWEERKRLLEFVHKSLHPDVDPVVEKGSLEDVKKKIEELRKNANPWLRGEGVMLELEKELSGSS